MKIGTWDVHFMNARGRLSPYTDRIAEAIVEVARRSNEIVPEIALDIEIEAAQYGGIPETGHSGYVPRPGLMRLMFDPTNEHLKKNMGEPLERMIAHELHHALRWDTVGYGTTLLGALASEGLCGRFAQELYGNEPEIWERGIEVTDVKFFAREAVIYADSEKYNHQKWFFGSGDLPRWVGYTLGYHMVGRACELMSRKPSDLIATPESEFKPALRDLADA